MKLLGKAVKFLGDGEITLACWMLCLLGVIVVFITAQGPEDCKPTGETRPTTSFILVGPIAVPYTFQQPVYECSKKRDIND